MESSGKVILGLLPHFTSLLSEGAGVGAGGEERQEEARGVRLWGSFSASLPLLGLVWSGGTDRGLPASPRPGLSFPVKRGSSAQARRILRKVPPGHPVFRKMSQKGGSIAEFL